MNIKANKYYINDKLVSRYDYLYYQKRAGYYIGDETLIDFYDTCNDVIGVIKQL